MLVKKPSGLKSARDLNDWSLKELSRLLEVKDDDGPDYNSPEGIVQFVKEIIGASPADYQEEILADFVRHKRMAIRAPHGAGKTALSSWIVLWAVTCIPGDVKVITTASAWRQVEHYTWPEIRRWAMRANWAPLGIQMRRNREVLSLRINNGEKQAFGVASDNPAYIEGAHATTVVYIFDEAKTISGDIFDAAEGAFSAAGEDTEATAYALAISTPGDPSGRFYDICARKKGHTNWATRHITLEECIKAGRISQQWVDEVKELWGEDSAIYANRALGEFDKSGEDNVVPLAWIDAAHKRWYAWKKAGGEKSVAPSPAAAKVHTPFNPVRVQVTGKRNSPREMPPEPPRIQAPAYGVDPAWKGKDKTAICKLVGRVVPWIKNYTKQSPMETAGRVAAMIESKRDVIAVDNIGIGAGVYDRLRELKYRAYAMDVRKKTKARDKTGKREFVNLRSYAWWMIREALDPDGDDPIAIPPIDELTDDLTAPRWRYRSDGKIQVESKDEMKKRNDGNSPDMADALALALYAARRRKIAMV